MRNCVRRGHGGLGRQEVGRDRGLTEMTVLSFSGTRGQNIPNTSKHA